MARRTKKDVRVMGGETEYVDDSSLYGRLDVSEIPESRVEKWVEHEWIVSVGSPELLESGKAIMMRWNLDARPDRALKQEGVPGFIRNAKNKYDLYQGEIGDRSYRGLRVMSHSRHVPEGYDDYIEREIRGGKTELEIMGHMMSRGHHVMLKGHAGTGKSGAVKHLAEMTQRNCSQVNFSEEVRISHLFGHYEVHSDGQGGTEQEWIDGVLTERARDGGLFIADEANMMTGDTSSILHSAMERGANSQMTIPQKGETIDVHPDFRIVATINPRYAGTNQVNKAFGDRFFELELDYLDSPSETDVVHSRVEGIERSDVESLVDLGRDLREDFLQGEVSEIVTPRSMIRAADLAGDGFLSLEEAAKIAYLEEFPPEEKTPVEKTIETYRF